jgi:hypothetical protein
LERNDILEKRFKQIGMQLKVLGIVFFLAGVGLTIFDVEGGIVILALGLLTAIQGVIIGDAFQN